MNSTLTVARGRHSRARAARLARAEFGPGQEGRPSHGPSLAAVRGPGPPGSRARCVRLVGPAHTGRGEARGAGRARAAGGGSSRCLRKTLLLLILLLRLLLLLPPLLLLLLLLLLRLLPTTATSEKNNFRRFLRRMISGGLISGGF